jgi:hypothetical protein
VGCEQVEQFWLRHIETKRLKRNLELVVIDEAVLIQIKQRKLSRRQLYIYQTSGRTPTASFTSSRCSSANCDSALGACDCGCVDFCATCCWRSRSRRSRSRRAASRAAGACDWPKLRGLPRMEGGGCCEGPEREEGYGRMGKEECWEDDAMALAGWAWVGECVVADGEGAVKCSLGM